MYETYIPKSCADLSTVSASSIQQQLADLPAADHPVVLTGEGDHGAATALPGEALSPAPIGTAELAPNFSINDMPELYDDEVYKVSAKVKNALAPFDRDIASAASFELLVKWLLEPLLDKLFHEVKEFMCSDTELTAMSPRPIPPLEDQAKRFLSLFPADEILFDPDQDVEMSTFSWLTSPRGFPESIEPVTHDKMGNERALYFVVHFSCGCLGNGAGFIFRYIQVHHGLRLRTLIKDGDFYCGWYDRPSKGEDQIVDDLLEYGIQARFTDEEYLDAPVPGILGAEMIYNDI